MTSRPVDSAVRLTEPTEATPLKGWTGRARIGTVSSVTKTAVIASKWSLR